jgi:2-keto-4-pentenoate hydratase/2-oxohepta-3-ene-1,7-dioic acid hydratase in catechol pathway
MRLATLKDGRLAGVLPGALVPLQQALSAAGGGTLPGEMRALLAEEAALVEAARAIAFAARPENAGLRLPLDEALLDAPLRPGQIVGVGRNYADHAKEVGGPRLEAPRLFLKPASSVCGPGTAVRIPRAVTKPDWEAELAVVIGAPAFEVEERRALDHVAAYTALNDLSAREFQFDQPLPMTSFAKGLEGFCPLGPWLVTADAFGEPWAVEVRCALNGEEVQRGNTRELIHSVPALIAYISRYMRLETGDVIATGTPAGSGHFRNPPRYLRSGDMLEITVSGIGALRHSIA